MSCASVFGRSAAIPQVRPLLFGHVAAAVGGDLGFVLFLFLHNLKLQQGEQIWVCVREDPLTGKGGLAGLLFEWPREEDISRQRRTDGHPSYSSAANQFFIFNFSSFLFCCVAMVTIWMHQTVGKLLGIQWAHFWRKTICLFAFKMFVCLESFAVTLV